MIKFGQKINTTAKDIVYAISSDLHFWHKNILKFCSDTRPWGTVEEMNQGLVAEINTMLSHQDVLIHVGDFSFGNKEQTQEILNQINCNIVHIYGNHSKVLRNQFNCGTDYLEFTYNGTKIVLNHYAQRVWNNSHHGSLHMWGHSHGSLPEYGRSMDVGYDAHGKILLLGDAIDYLVSKPIRTPDHH